jgi:hypothetical protein
MDLGIINNSLDDLCLNRRGGSLVETGEPRREKADKGDAGETHDTQSQHHLDKAECPFAPVMPILYIHFVNFSLNDQLINWELGEAHQPAVDSGSNTVDKLLLSID